MEVDYLAPGDTWFPDPRQALLEPNGLLAIGGDLAPARLLAAYSQGIFPWYEDGQPILWWSPSSRAVLYPDKIHISRSLKKVIRSDVFRVTADQCFDQVIAACGNLRRFREGTWLTNDMLTAYGELHRLGHAHSIEVWHQGVLVGGLYGIALGKVFFGESMFSRHSNASKVALVALADYLTKQQFVLIDCQIESEHLHSMGARSMERDAFMVILKNALQPPFCGEIWQL